MDADAEVELDGDRRRRRSSSVSASSSGSTRTTWGPGLSPAIENWPRSFSVKLPTSAPVRGLNATTCAPKTGLPVQGHPPGDAARVVVEAAVGIEIGDAGDVVGAERPVRDVAGANAIGNMTASAGHHAPSAGRQLGLTERGVSQSAQVTDLVQRDASRDRSGRRSPVAATDQAKAELKKMSDSRSSPVDFVDEEARRRQHAIELGTVVEAERRFAVVVARQRGREAAELIGNRRRRHRLPGRERPPDRVAELSGRDTGDAPLGHAVAHRAVGPLQRQLPAVHDDAEFQIRIAGATSATTMTSIMRPAMSGRRTRMAKRDVVMAPLPEGLALGARTRRARARRRDGSPRTIGPRLGRQRPARAASRPSQIRQQSRR